MYQYRKKNGCYTSGLKLEKKKTTLHRSSDDNHSQTFWAFVITFAQPHDSGYHSFFCRNDSMTPANVSSSTQLPHNFLSINDAWLTPVMFQWLDRLRCFLSGTWYIMILWWYEKMSMSFNLTHIIIIPHIHICRNASFLFTNVSQIKTTADNHMYIIQHQRTTNSPVTVQ